MIDVTSVQFFDDYSWGGARNGPMLSNSGSSVFMGSVGDVMYAQIEFQVLWNTTDVPMTFGTNAVTINPCGTTTGTTGSYITDGFQANDTFILAGTGTPMDGNTYTIESLTNTTINITGTFTSPGSYSSVSIYGTTPVTTIDLSYNLVSTPPGSLPTEDFLSLSDVVNQTLTVTSPSTALVPLTSQSAAWFDGPPLPDVWSSYYNTVTAGTPTLPHAQAYVANIMLTTKPIFLSGQQQTLKSLIAPPAFYNNSTLSFVYQINARYNTLKKLANQTSDPNTFTVGNVGWFNQFLNGNPANYTLSYVSYADHATGAPLTSIDYVNPTDVTIVVYSVNDTFTGSPAGTQCAVNFSWLPSTQSSYQNLPSTYQESMLWDHAHIDVGMPTSPSERGWLYGSPYQIFDNVSATEISTNELEIKFTTNFGVLAQRMIGNGGSYMLWVTPQASGIVNLPTTDRNAVLCDVNAVFTNTDDPTQLTIITSTPDQATTNDILVFKYPEINSTPYTNFAGVSGDYTFARCDFSVPLGSQITSVNTAIKAVTYNSQITNSFDNIVGSTTLESWNNSLVSQFNGHVTQANVVQMRNFPFQNAIVPIFQELVFINSVAESSATFNLLYNNIQPSTVQIQYVIASANYVGNDDGNGNIVGTGIAGGSTINYESGLVEIFWSISPDNASQIRCGYTSNNVDFRNVRSITRIPQYDTDSTYACRLIYGFQAGFNYAQAVQSNDPNIVNVRSQDWSMYFNAGVTPLFPLAIRLELDVVWNILDTSTGITTQFEQTMPILVGNNRQNPINYTATILTYDLLGNPLGNDAQGNPNFAVNEATLVVAHFTGSGIDNPGSFNTVAIELSVYYRSGNNTVYDTTSTLYPIVSNSLWRGTPSITYSSPAVTATAIVDFTNTGVTGIRALCKIDYVNSNT